MLKFTGDGFGLPSVVMLDSNLSTKLPRFSWASNRIGIASSGSGLGLDSLRRAMGEFFERRHFYHEVRGDTVGTLASTPDRRLRQDLMRCLVQTAEHKSRPNLRTHRFQHRGSWFSRAIQHRLRPPFCFR